MLTGSVPMRIDAINGEPVRVPAGLSDVRVARPRSAHHRVRVQEEDEDMADLSGTVGVVTGAGSGLGAASAELFAARGAAVVVTDRVADAAQEVAARIAEHGGQAEAVSLDVTDERAVDACFGAVSDRYGRLDWAHNNAGVEGPFATTTGTSLDDWNATLAVNVTGVFLCMRAELRIMEPVRAGAIVNTASINSYIAHERTAAYSASKAAVLGLTRAAALEQARNGIRINAVCPGWMVTPMTTVRASEMLGRDVIAAASKIVPMGRAAHPSELAELVVWLASPAASYLTGQGIVADGGFTLA
jgi:NAD(P)-dependent dehydrogenase (short-subunit alcohol dehydrogenase family)